MHHSLRCLTGLFAVVGSVLAGGVGRADVTLPAIISDHMVLQAEVPARIWGKAAAGETVEAEAEMFLMRWIFISLNMILGKLMLTI